MRLLSLSAALLLGVAILRAGEPTQAQQAELEKYTGTWEAVYVEHQGKALPPNEVRAIKLLVAGEKYTVKIGKMKIEGTHQLDPSARPKRIDAVRSKDPSPEKTLKGIYELGPDSFKVCYGAAGKERPTQFSTREGGQRLLAFRREKLPPEKKEP